MTEARTLSHAMLAAHPDAAAGVLNQVDVESVAAFLRETPVRLSAHVVSKMQPQHVTRALALLDHDSAAALIQELEAHGGAAALRHLPAAARNAILERLPAKLGRSIQRLLKFPETTVGAWMETQTLVLPGDLPVHKALRQYRRLPMEAAGYIYVTDDKGRLRGAVALTSLAHASNDKTLAQLMVRDLEGVPALLSLTLAANNHAWSRHHTLPVVDESNRLLGALPYPVLRHALQQLHGTEPAAPMHNTLAQLADSYWAALSGLTQITTDLIYPAIQNTLEGRRHER